MSQGQSADCRSELRHRVQSVLAGEHGGGLPDRRRHPRQPDRQRSALGRLDHAPRPARLLHRDGPHRELDAGAAARLAGPARRPGRRELLQGIPGRDRNRPAGRTAARRGLRRRARRGPGRGHGRSRRRPVRGHSPRRRAGHSGRLDVRPACQRLAQDDRQSLGVRRLPREPAHRHLRARRRSRQAHARVPGRRAHRGHHGQGAAGAAADLVADRQGPLRRPDQVRPDQGGRRHPERLGDGGLRLQRQPQERPHRRGDRAQRQPPGGGRRCRSTSPSAPGA